MIERTSSCGNIRNLVVGVPGLSYGSDSSGSGSQSSSPSPRGLRRQHSTGALHTLSKSGTVPSSSGLRRANSNPHPLLPTLSRQRQRRSSTGSFHSIGTQSQRASRRSSFESSLDCGRSTISADVGRYLSVKAARNSSRDGGEPQSSSSSRGRRSRDQDPPALSARESKRPEPIKSLQLHPAWGRYATAQSVAELIASVPSVSIALAEARESEFEVEKKIGQGAVGEVFLARHAKSNATLALKRVNKADVFRRRKLKRVFMERAVGAAVAGCRFLCHYLYIYDTPEEVHYLTKYYRGGTLFHYLHRHGPLSMDRLRTVAAEILIAIETLHSLNFVHRDLKPENILIDEDGHVCLADFDLCERFAPLGASARSASPLITSPAGARSPTGPSERCELCGTLEYLAPEMLDGTTASAKSLDWWSLGVLMYEMAHLRTPWVFQGAKQKEVVSNILHLQVPFDERCVSIECEDLIRLLLVRDPDARVCDSKRLKKHPFFKGIRWKSLHKRKGPLADVAQNPSPVSGKQARPSCEPLEGQDLADVNQLLRAFRPWADARSHKRLIRGKSI